MLTLFPRIGFRAIRRALWTGRLASLLVDTSEGPVTVMMEVKLWLQVPARSQSPQVLQYTVIKHANRCAPSNIALYHETSSMSDVLSEERLV
jgi:hypothetical protein